MSPQQLNWTCAACSLDWLLRATALDLDSTRPRTIEAIGYPHNINPQFGLMDSSGRALRDVLDTYDQPSGQAWLDFDTTYALAQHTAGMLSGAKWYHWTAIRGITGGALWIANSAPGYCGIFDVLTREDWARLGGFSVVWLEEG